MHRVPTGLKPFDGQMAGSMAMMNQPTHSAFNKFLPCNPFMKSTEESTNGFLRKFNLPLNSEAERVTPVSGIAELERAFGNTEKCNQIICSNGNSENERDETNELTENVSGSDIDCEEIDET